MDNEASLDLVIPFRSAEEAQIAYNTLVVDKEPKRSQCKKELSVEGNRLKLKLIAAEPRQLRLSSNSFFDYLNLVLKTIDQFSLDSSKRPKLSNGADAQS